MKTVLLCLLNTGLMVTGQMLFKYGAADRKITGIMDMVHLLFTPTIILALGLYAFTACLWLYILSRTPMSFAYPFQALAFPLVLMLSALLFHESIPLNRWIGVVVIVVGVIIATRG